MDPVESQIEYGSPSEAATALHREVARVLSIPKPEAETNNPPEREVLTRLEGFQNGVITLRKMPSVNDRELVIRSVAAFYGLTVE